MEVKAQESCRGAETNVAIDSEVLSVARVIIRQALTSVLQGDVTSYNQLLGDLRNFQNGDLSFDDSFIVMTLKALSQSISSINEHHHGSLISSVLGMSLWNLSADAGDALVEFIINLAASNGVFVDRCLDMLVRNFLPPSCGLPLFLDSITSRIVLSGGNSAEKLSNKRAEHLGRKGEVLSRVYLAIQKVAQLVPTAALRLQPIIIRRMPHRFTPLEWNALYIENMLRVESSGVGEIIGNRLLMAVVDRLIEIDVEIRWEDIGHDDLSKVYVFDMEMGDENDDPKALQKEKLGDVADKMDVLMDMTLEHLKSCVEEGRLIQVYDTLMQSFQSTILNTHKSKFTQFLIFYLCSLAPTTCGAQFASKLCDIFVNKSRPPNTRMTAAAYLASFLSRAKYLPLSVISASLTRLFDWCLFYIEDDKKSMNPKLHRVFYSACQAVMYILCFRMKVLNDNPEQKVLIRQLPVKKLLWSCLNPLKVCLPSVVHEFLRQARVFNLFECLGFLGTNDMLESDESKSFGGVERLDMFFPFDPYLLKQSDRFIRPNFLFWSMVQAPEDNELDNTVVEEGFEDIMDEEDDSSDDDSYGVTVAEDVVEYISTRELQNAQSDDEDMDSFENSMNKMCITPNGSTLSCAKTMPAILLPSMR